MEIVVINKHCLRPDTELKHVSEWMVLCIKACNYREEHMHLFESHSDFPWLPELTASLLTFDRNKFWYTEFEPMRRAYFRVRWVANGVRPFHNARTPSSLMTVLPQWYMPLYLPVVIEARRVERVVNAFYNTNTRYASLSIHFSPGR